MFIKTRFSATSAFVCEVHSRSHFLDRHFSGGTSSVSAKMVFHEVSQNTFNSAGLRATCSKIPIFNTIMNVRIHLRKLLLRHPVFVLATLESNRASRVPRCPSQKSRKMYCTMLSMETSATQAYPFRFLCCYRHSLNYKGEHRSARRSPAIPASRGSQIVSVLDAFPN